MIRRDNLVGFEDEEQTIIGYLLKENEGLDVISIVGMSGLGKTTLAWRIYENENICYAFPIRIWIHVSQNFNKRDMMLNILRSFTSQDMSSVIDDELSQTVLTCLQKEKFLLVFDDVCSLADWQAIQYFLPESNGMGKVLITSSNNEVCSYTSKYRRADKLRFLSEEESWMLLQLEVFGKMGDCPQELEAIGQLIARKCGGLPLQIVVVGGVLVDLLMKFHTIGTIRMEWEKVLENVNLFLHHQTSLSDAVELTYSRLPDELSVCFLYLGVFPDGYEIPTWTLTRLWIAEGFVQTRNGWSLEETANQNLNDLITRNLVNAEKISPNGEVKTCRVHGMIGMFCRGKAQEQNLFLVVKRSQEGVFVPPISDLKRFRRVCVHSNINNLLSEVRNSPQVRSILCFNEFPTNLDPRYISAIPAAFNLLKVLESESIRFHQFPKGITRLFHLRYITLSIDDLSFLPDTLSELWNLQTLVVNTKSRTIMMKANIWRLIRLRHLKTNAAILLSPTGKDGAAGENLQTLSTLAPESCTVDLCERAPNLKALRIGGKLATLFTNSSIAKLDHLETLKLVNDLLFETACENPLRDLPDQHFFPQNLKRLTLSNTFFQWKHVSTLASINNLEVLKLKDNAFVGIYWSAIEDSFSSLQFMYISNTDLVLWEASPSSFPRLSCLVVKNCENLKEIPVALGESLEKLDIDRLRASAVNSAMRIADEKKNKAGAPFKLHLGPMCQT